LQAALAVVAEVGLAGLSIDAVAARAGVGTGTVYVYFKGKDALVGALYDAVKSELVAHVLSDDGGPVRLGIERMCRAFLEWLRTRATEQSFLEQIEESPVYRERGRSAAAVAMRPLHAVLERGKAERLVKNIPSEVLIAFVVGAMRETSRSLAPLSGSQREERIAEITALCWGAIAL
jgi:AcrR family transcriptional regulator